MCCGKPGIFAQCCMIFLPGLLGLSLTFFLGCFVHGADIKLALIIYLAVINVITFVAYACDKLTAADSMDMGGGGWRCAEVALWSFIFLGGTFGAWLGMIVCCHKLCKHPFIFVAIALSIFSLTWVFLWLILTAEDNLSDCYKYQKEVTRGNYTGK